MTDKSPLIELADWHEEMADAWKSANQLTRAEMQDRHRAAAKTCREADWENSNWKRWGVIEIAIRNPNVSSSMRHWEERAEKAEAEVARLKRLVEELMPLVNSLTRYEFPERDALLARLREAVK